MDIEEFRKYGHIFVDWVADYYRDIERYSVCAKVQPGR